MNLQTLAQKLNGQLIGDATFKIKNVAELSTATSIDISFCLEKKFIEAAEKSNAGALITFTECNVKNQIVVKNPRKALAQTIDFFTDMQCSLSNKAISEKAIIDASVFIGHYVTIGENSRISKNTKIHSHTSIGNNCSIGQKLYN